MNRVVFPEPVGATSARFRKESRKDSRCFGENTSPVFRLERNTPVSFPSIHRASPKIVDRLDSENPMEHGPEPASARAAGEGGFP